ncbi:SPOR domain-containing protein [Flavobacterium sp. GNP001]
MKISAFKKGFYLILTYFLTTHFAAAQAEGISIKQDSRFEQILNEKRKTGSNNAISDRYKIQIFSGESDKAKTNLATFRQEYPGIDGTIVFFTPNYKVWVGNFKTRIEAEQLLLEIKKRYPMVHLIKPSR